jgi:glycosyltransferase involved in cell wall biosynthesis
MDATTFRPSNLSATAGVDLSIVAIIPLYNGGWCIEEAVRSVFAQGLPPDEFIVVDDGSTDDGPAIVERLAREHPIRLLRKSNGGQSAARNFGIRRSKSAFIALLDHDDRWYPNHLEELVKPVKGYQGLPLGWVYSDFDDIDKEGKMIDRNFLDRYHVQNPKRRLFALLRHGVIIQPSATLISRAAFEAVGGFDERLSGYEDDDLFLRIFQANYENLYVPRSTSQWRIHASSSGASERHETSLKIYTKKLLESFPDDCWRGHYYARDAIAPRIIHTYLGMYTRASRYKNRIKMRTYADDALSLVPLLRLKRRIVFSVFLWLLRTSMVIRIISGTQHKVRWSIPRPFKR